jgi:phospholipase/carboxylesterase
VPTQAIIHIIFLGLTNMSDSPLIVETGSNPPDSCVIWLHGLGADGHDFEPIVPELGLSPDLNVRFVFPHAPMIPVTINQGFVMRAWYDIAASDIAERQDESGIRSSQAVLIELIEAQIAEGIDSTRIVLAGFSQGGVIALQTGLRFNKPLAGIMALSTYLPLAETLAAEKSDENLTIPVFLAHGSADPVIAVDLAYSTRGHLEKQGYQPSWHEYDAMQHSVCAEEIEHMSQWFGTVLA